LVAWNCTNLVQPFQILTSKWDGRTPKMGLFVQGPEHRCTRVENPGEGVPDVFCQNP
jgi:hypothetical protein